jgi:hypothetical protein
MFNVGRHFMKHLFILISSLTLTLSCLAQDKHLKLDTFQKVDGFVSTYLLISSDSAFFAAFANCGEAEITKGRWRQSKDKITLIADNEEKAAIKADVQYEANSKDSLIAFRIQDYFKRPFADYGTIFFDNEFKEHQLATDDEGIVKVPKDKFVAYLTADEYDNMSIGSYILNNVHFLWNGLSDVRVTLNYPKEILTNRPRVTPFAYRGDTFIKTVKGLTSPLSRLTLEKL